MSTLFLRTLRDDPAKAELIGIPTIMIVGRSLATGVVEHLVRLSRDDLVRLSRERSRCVGARGLSGPAPPR